MFLFSFLLATCEQFHQKLASLCAIPWTVGKSRLFLCIDAYLDIDGEVDKRK